MGTDKRKTPIEPREPRTLTFLGQNEPRFQFRLGTLMAAVVGIAALLGILRLLGPDAPVAAVLIVAAILGAAVACHSDPQADRTLFQVSSEQKRPGT